MPLPLAVYIHWPFCQSKCPYCDFNSFVAAGVDHAAWRAAYRRELEHYAALLPGRRITSVFFGGGTPSLMEPETASVVLDSVSRLWTMDEDVEITLEANPGSVEAEKFAAFRAAGINRLSLGVQALNDADLKFLGRAHSVAEARQAIELSQRYFPRSSFDLIYARAGQSPDAWQAELREALSIAAGHLSLYQLTIEPNTAFHIRAARGEQLTAAENPAADMYEMTNAMMAEAGRPSYEISNYARPGDESRHNLTYWHYNDYIGIGPGAHGRLNISATALRYAADGSSPQPRLRETCEMPPRAATDNHRAPDVWMKAVMEHGHGRRQQQPLALEDSLREALMMGLRLVEGIDSAAWRQKFGVGIDAVAAPAKKHKLRDEGYLWENEGRMGLTPQGLQRLNGVLAYLAG